MLEPDTSKTNKTEDNSPGMMEGTKGQTFVCQHLAKVFQPHAAQELAVSYTQHFSGWGFSSMSNFQGNKTSTLNGNF